MRINLVKKGNKKESRKVSENGNGEGCGGSEKKRGWKQDVGREVGRGGVVGKGVGDL